MLSALHNDAPDAPDPQPDNSGDDTPEPDPAAVAAARQREINTEATSLLASANALLPSVSGASAGTAAQPDPNAALSALLDDGPPSNTSTAAINSLLGDSAQQGAGDSTVTAAVNNLLSGDDTPPPSAVNVPSGPNAPQPGDPFYQPPAPDPSKWYTPPAPLQNQAMDADLQESVDQPNPSMFDTLKQELRSGIQTGKGEINDGLSGLMTSGQSLIAQTINDTGVQAIIHVVLNGGATMPLTAPTDSGDTMVRNVAGQALLGSTDIIKEGPVKGRHTAGTKMIDQYSAYMGWAQVNIQGDGGAQP